MSGIIICFGYSSGLPVAAKDLRLSAGSKRYKTGIETLRGVLLVGRTVTKDVFTAKLLSLAKPDLRVYGAVP
jgi:hypothetical protein